MIANVHIAPGVTIPVAVILALGLAWYWLRLGRSGVPPARRRLRRLTTAVMIVALPNVVRGISFLDPAVDRTQYVLSWSVTMLVLLLLLVAAIADGALSLRLHRQEVETELNEAASELAAALRRRDGNGPDSAARPDAGPEDGAA